MTNPKAPLTTAAPIALTAPFAPPADSSMFGIGYVVKFVLVIVVLGALVYAVNAYAPTHVFKDNILQVDDQEKKDIKITMERAKRIQSQIKAASDKNSSKPKVEQYCYAGEYGGLRTCVPVSESQKCMSGDIFPTENQCVNPNLRYV